MESILLLDKMQLFLGVFLGACIIVVRRQCNVEMDGEDRAIPGNMFVGPESMYCADHVGKLHALGGGSSS